MMKPYIKEFQDVYLRIYTCAGWYVSYTPHKYYAHLRNVLIQPTTSPLVVIVINKQSFQLK